MVMEMRNQKTQIDLQLIKSFAEDVAVKSFKGESSALF